jgi:glycosyltransferase involved in cell wall biosynthesis
MGRIWDEAKNVQLLVNAAPELPWDIRIAGQQQFEKDEAPLGSNKTHFLGKLDIDRIAAELSEASIYVLPAKYEPFGLSALEAALSGCALVLGDIPSLREIWQDAAVYVDVNNLESLVSAINGLINDQELYDNYSAKAEARANFFSSGAMADEYLEAYQKLIQIKEAFV